MIKHLRSLAFILIFLSPLSSFASPCNLNQNWISTTLLSTLLAGNPSLVVDSESAELRLRNGAISLAAQATLFAPNTGGITFTGTGDLKARGRFTVVSRGRQSFIRINSISADIFKTKLFVNGELASEQNYESLVFGDSEIAFRCASNRLQLTQDIEGVRRVLTFSPARRR